MIEDGLLDPVQARCSREEQRRRILLELESPLPAPSEQTVTPDGMSTELLKIEKRAELMRRRNFYEKDPERRALVNERIAGMLREARRTV